MLLIVSDSNARESMADRVANRFWKYIEHADICLKKDIAVSCYDAGLGTRLSIYMHYRNWPDIPQDAQELDSPRQLFEKGCQLGHAESCFEAETERIMVADRKVQSDRND